MNVESHKQLSLNFHNFFNFSSASVCSSGAGVPPQVEVELSTSSAAASAAEATSRVTWKSARASTLDSPGAATETWSWDPMASSVLHPTPQKQDSLQDLIG